MRPGLDDLRQLVAPLNDAELDVAHALAGLDDDWTIYIHPRIGHDVPDFVAVHDRHGVCAIEVIELTEATALPDAATPAPNSGSNDVDPSTLQPRAQALRYRTTIFDRFFAMPDDTRDPTRTVRAAVVAPRMSTETARKVLGSGSLAGHGSDSNNEIPVSGGDHVTESLEHIVRGCGCPPPRPESLRRLKRQLAESSIILDLQEPARLSPDARNIERNPSGARIRRVRGPAGCGKSFGLAARAARLASDGKDVLVLSFNPTLSNYLRTLVNARCREYAANPSLVTCSDFHQFCARLVDDATRAGFETSAPTDIGTTTETDVSSDVVRDDRIIQRAQDACNAGYSTRFDAVLVDEGQDFTLDWWNLLRHHVVALDGEMLLVADPTQDVDGKRAWTDEERMLGAGFSGKWTEITSSYRMPGDLVEIANEFAEHYVTGEQIAGRVPRPCVEADITHTATSQSVRRWFNTERAGQLGIEVGHEVVRLLTENPHVAPNDVAFLLEAHSDGLAAVIEIERAGYAVHHVFSETARERESRRLRFWPGSNDIKGCTVDSFKGWEAPAVVMGIGTSKRSSRLAYVSMTRTKGGSTTGPSFISVVNADLRIAGFQSRFEEWVPPNLELLAV